MRLIGIDLFAGAGGLSLGFEQAGFDIAAAVEIDPVHCATHKFNFPHTAIVPRSVEGLSGAAIVEAAGIGYRPVDCVFGGAPCQGFSLIGHRVLDDPRNRLVREFVRHRRGTGRADIRLRERERAHGRPASRLPRRTRNGIFGRRLRCADTPWRVLNAGHFGTPQHRERLILLGARKGERLPDYPDADDQHRRQSPPHRRLTRRADLRRCARRSSRRRRLRYTDRFRLR